jgi:hypothetical protein
MTNETFEPVENTFIGVKVVIAKSMNRADYNIYRGWELPSNEDGSDEGYLVEYTDGGKPNHSDHEGYISWSPAEQFENAYTNIKTGVNFGHALEMMKQGFKVARLGWNGKGMWLIYVPGSESVKPVAGTPYSKAGIVESVNINPHIDMFTADGCMQPGWLASQTDMLAEDWFAIGKCD